MSDDSQDQACASQPDPSNFSHETVDLPGTIVRRLGQALLDAADRVQRAMAGESVFANEGDRRTTMSLVNQLPRLLPAIRRYRPQRNRDSNLVPRCWICGAKPGNHWAHDCPQINGEGKEDLIYDYRRGRTLSYKDFVGEDNPLPPVIPVCTICRANLGHHWAKDCPQRRDCPEHNQAIEWQIQTYAPQTDGQDTSFGTYLASRRSAA